MNYTEEQIGKVAKRLLEDALLMEVASLFGEHYYQREMKSRFSNHIRGNNKKEIRELEVYPTYKKYTYIDGRKKKFLKQVRIRLERHGFVQHYGIEPRTVRAGSSRISTLGKEFSIEPHEIRKGMKPKLFIDKAVKESGIAEYVTKKITEYRGQDIVISISEAFMRGLENV